MRRDFENWMHILQQAGFIRSVPCKGKIDHGQVDWLKLCDLRSDEKFACFRMRTISADDQVCRIN